MNKAWIYFVVCLLSLAIPAQGWSQTQGKAKPASNKSSMKTPVAPDPDVVVTKDGVSLRKVETKKLNETPATEEGETYLLRYRFEPGQVLRNEVIYLSKNGTRINSVLQEASSRTVTDKSWHVLEADDASVTFEYRVDSIDLSQQFGENSEIRYNTKEPVDPIPVQFASAVENVGKVISTIRIDLRGMVIARSDSKDPPHMGMGDITMPVPEKPVGIGATWEIPRELRKIGRAHV